MWDYICKSYVVKKSNERVEEEARVALGQGQHVTFNVRIQRKGHVVRYYAGGSSDRPRFQSLPIPTKGREAHTQALLRYHTRKIARSTKVIAVTRRCIPRHITCRSSLSHPRTILVTINRGPVQK
jgi:hypothetical protein